MWVLIILQKDLEQKLSYSLHEYCKLTLSNLIIQEINGKVEVEKKNLKLSDNHFCLG